MIPRNVGVEDQLKYHILTVSGVNLRYGTISILALPICGPLQHSQCHDAVVLIIV